MLQFAIISYRRIKNSFSKINPFQSEEIYVIKRNLFNYMIISNSSNGNRNYPNQGIIAEFRTFSFVELAVTTFLQRTWQNENERFHGEWGSESLSIFLEKLSLGSNNLIWNFFGYEMKLQVKGCDFIKMGVLPHVFGISVFVNTHTNKFVRWFTTNTNISVFKFE